MIHDTWGERRARSSSIDDPQWNGGDAAAHPLCVGSPRYEPMRKIAPVKNHLTQRRRRSSSRTPTASRQHLRQLFEAWREAGNRVLAVEKFGHDARYPVTSNWPHLRSQLLAFIEHEAGAPVFLVGHSMGGYLNVLAALRRPELVRGLVLLDSPLLGGLAGQVMRLGKATGAIRRFSPGHVSQRRRQHWPDAEAAYAHFAAKPAFARWAPGVLRDYIASGVQPRRQAMASRSGARWKR
jgi:pimeloyl-ACP methyl ester carboxylesterase